MGTCAVIIEQEIEGQPYETVHGVQGELDLIGEDGQPSEAFMLELFANQLPNANFDPYTDPIDAEFLPTDFGIIGSLVAFHRYMQVKLVRLTRLYITDGRKSTGGQPNVFYSLPLDLPCRGVQYINDDQQANVGPVNQALLVDKVPKGFGARAGRMFLRGTFLTSQLIVGGRNGVIINPAVDGFIADRLNNGVTQSGLATFFDTGTDADQAVVYAILNYRTKSEYSSNPALKGQVKGSTGVSSLRFGGATGRQANRPSKRQ